MTDEEKIKAVMELASNGAQIHQINFGNGTQNIYTDKENRNKDRFGDIDRYVVDVDFKEITETEEDSNSKYKETETVDQEELCHFLYPGIDEEEGKAIHRQIKDLVSRFAMKDICDFLKGLAEEKKILLPQIPQNAFEELHRMGMPKERKGFGYDNFCKYYRNK